MTKEQVASFKQFGPYRSFSNGDLETYNGVYRGQKRNAQFYFQNNKLVKIMVSLGESTSRDKTIQSFRQAYAILEKDYGKVVVPEIHVGKGSETVNAEVLGIAAAANASLTGYTHINPVNQPRDMHVWGTVASTIIGNKRWFYVWIMFEPR
jgi:stress response protein YsnF